MAPATSKIVPEIDSHVESIDAWKTFVRGLAKRIRSNSRRCVEAFCAEAEVFALLEACSSDKIRVVRFPENSPSDGAFIINPQDLKSIPPIGTPYMEMLDWVKRTPGVKYLTFDVKSVEFRPINSNLHYRSGYHDIAYKWTEIRNKGKEATTDVVIATFEGINDEVAIMPWKVWDDARDWGYGVEPLMYKAPPFSQIFMVGSNGQLETAVQELLHAALDPNHSYTSPSTGVTLDGWELSPGEDVGSMLSRNEMHNHGDKALRSFARQIASVGGQNRVFGNPIQPLLGDALLQVEGLERLLLIEHKSDEGRFSGKGIRALIGPQSPFSPARVWDFVIFHSDVHEQAFVCIPRDAVQSHWHQVTSLPWNNVRHFHFDTIQDLLRFIKARAQGAMKAAAAAMSRLGEAGEEALISSTSIDLLMTMVADREEAYSRPAKGAFSKGAQHFLRNLPWVSVDLNKLCAKYRYGLVFPLPVGHGGPTHVFVHYEWEDSDDPAHGLPLLISSHKLSSCRVVPLYFVDNRAHMSGVPAIGWPVNLSRNDWQRRGLDQDFLYVGSCMESAYMEDPASRKQYWLFSSQFTTQLSQGLKRTVASEDKQSHFFAREGIEEDLLPQPKLEQGRRPTAVYPGSGFLADAYKHINPATYILDGEEELYQHLCGIIRGTGPFFINNPQSLTPNTAITAERHQTTLQQVMQATWDFGVARRSKKLDDSQA